MIIKQLHVDLWQKILQPITVVQHEAEGRRLAITLTGGGLPVNLTGCDVIFYAQKPDENILFNNCVIVDEAAGQVEYTITEQTVVLAGTLKCWIVVIKDGKTIRSQEFHITVQESPDFTGAVESTSEFTDLEVALATIAGFDARLTAAEGDIDDLQSDVTTLEAERSGWMAVDEAWAYASANTITVPSGAASRYQKGMPFKLKANGSTLMGYIVDVADTLLTVLGHTLTNHEFTYIYYAKSGTVPMGFNDWFSYTPIFTGFSVNPVGEHRYKISGKKIEVHVRHTTAGTSNSTSFTMSAPIASAADVSTRWIGPAVVTNDGSNDAGYIQMVSGESVLTPTRNLVSTSWTASGGKRVIYGNVAYEY